MIEAGILDGDYVVIEQRYSASNGEIVVALVRNEEVTLKRIEQKRGGGGIASSECGDGGDELLTG